MYRVPRQTWLAGLGAARSILVTMTLNTTYETPAAAPRDLLRRASRGFFSSTLNIRYSMGSSCWQDKTPGNMKSQKTVFILNAKLSLYSRKLWRDSGHNLILYLVFHGFWIPNVTCGIVDTR